MKISKSEQDKILETAAQILADRKAEEARSREKNRKSVGITVFVTEEMSHSFETVIHRLGIAKSVALREAISQYIEKYLDE